MPYPSAKEIVLPSKKELFNDEHNENAIENQMLDLFSLFGDLHAARPFQWPFSLEIRTDKYCCQLTMN